VRTAEVLSQTAARLAQAGLENSLFEAETLASYAAGISRAKLISLMPDQYPPAAEAKLEEICRRREAREPFAYITGTKEFYGLDFFVTPDVLIPRPETESLVDAAVSLLPEGGSFLDLCCGSGIVGIALKTNRNDARVSASDISSAAIAVARINAHTLLNDESITFIQSDLFESIDAAFDMIAANPPYVAGEELPALAPELGFEPGLALFSDDGGFSHTERIISHARAHLVKDGILLVETNPSLKDRVGRCAEHFGFSLTIEKDLAGFSRFYFLRAV